MDKNEFELLEQMLRSDGPAAVFDRLIRNAREDKDARAKFDSSKGSAKKDLILAFIAQEFTDMTGEGRLDLLSKILDTMYCCDPGIGINRPGRHCG